MEHRNFPDIPLSQLGTHCYEIGKNETGKLRVRIQISVLAFLPREFYIPGSFSVDVVLDEPIVLTNITPLVLDFTPLPKKFH